MQKTLLIAISLLVISGIGWYFWHRITSPTSSSPSQTLTPQSDTNTSTYTLSEVATHSTAQSCWMVINNKVYDVTEYIPDHPGRAILAGCGKEATALFNQERKHTGRATAVLNQYAIGKLTLE